MSLPGVLFPEKWNYPYKNSDNYYYYYNSYSHAGFEYPGYDRATAHKGNRQKNK